MENQRMKRMFKDDESFLEAGLLLFGLGLLSAIGVLVMGRSAGGAKRGRRFAEPAPAPGRVSKDRNQNIQSASPR